jgi:hypothetical protein
MDTLDTQAGPGYAENFFSKSIFLRLTMKGNGGRGSCEFYLASEFRLFSAITRGTSVGSHINSIISPNQYLDPWMQHGSKPTPLC